jgi:hypothetical protein
LRGIPVSWGLRKRRRNGKTGENKLKSGLAFSKALFSPNVAIHSLAIRRKKLVGIPARAQGFALLMYAYIRYEEISLSAISLTFFFSLATILRSSLNIALSEIGM